MRVIDKQTYYFQHPSSLTYDSIVFVLTCIHCPVSLCQSILSQGLNVLVESLMVSPHLIESFPKSLESVSYYKLQYTLTKHPNEGVSSIAISVQFISTKIFDNNHCK